MEPLQYHSRPQQYALQQPHCTLPSHLLDPIGKGPIAIRSPLAPETNRLCGSRSELNIRSAETPQSRRALRDVDALQGLRQ